MCSSEALQEEFKFYGFYSIGQPVLESGKSSFGIEVTVTLILRVTLTVSLTYF